MTTDSAPVTAREHAPLAWMWHGNGRPSRWIIRLILLFLLSRLLPWLWQVSLSTARWTGQGKLASMVFVALTIFTVVWMVILTWQLNSSLGLKRVIIGLVIWYSFAVSLRLLTLPLGSPILASLIPQMVAVAQSGMRATTQALTSIPEAIDEFRVAYTGQRALVDMPGIDEPAEPLTGQIIEPNYPTFIDYQALPADPEIDTETTAPVIPTPSLPSDEPESPISGQDDSKLIQIDSLVVVVNTNGDRLRAHITPGVNTEITVRFPEESELQVLDGPVTEGDFRWWLVEGKKGKGWCAEPFLKSK
jgi:hypothetical protein